MPRRHTVETRSSLVTGLVTLGIMIALPGCASTRAQSVRKQLSKAYDVYTSAYVAEDYETVTSMIAPDFQGADLDGTTFDYAQFLKIIRSRMDTADYKSFDVTILDLENEGADWIATIREEFVSTSDKFHGQSVDIEEMYVTRDTWRRRDGKWVALGSVVVERDVRFNGMTPEAYFASLRGQAEPEPSSATP